MSTTIHSIPNLQQIKNNLIERLRPSGWVNKLKSFILSSEFDHVLEGLWKEKEEGRRFGPPLKQMFRAFEECPYDKLKVVIVAQDPYFTIQDNTIVADGIAFSCSNTGKLQPSLQHIFNAINKTVYPNEPYQQSPDLKVWSNQGVLLLNTALSVELNKAGSHYHLWRPFINYLLDTLNITQSGLIFWFMGNKAKEFESLISENSHYKFFTEHPSAASYRSDKIWKDLNTFNQINEILHQNNNTKIVW